MAIHEREKARLDSRARLVSVLRIIALVFPMVASGADILVLSNGDQLKGEIKKMTKEVVIFSTDYSDEDFKIKWEKVASISSDRTFMVENFRGQRVSGPIQPDPVDKKVTSVGSDKMPLEDIAYVQPFERGFWSRLDSGFDIGYSMTKANNVKQLSAGMNMVYTAERSIVTLAGNAFFNKQSNAPETRRWELSPEYKYLFGRVWYATGTANFYHSQEQQLSLRTTLSGGIGRYLLRKPTHYLAVGGGLAMTRERYQDEAIPRQTSAEAYAGFEYMTEQLKFADLTTRYVIFPSLSISGRYRFNFTFDLSFNLPGDWYMKSGYYNNFDSKPPAGLSRNDYGWVNSFGYKF